MKALSAMPLGIALAALLACAAGSTPPSSTASGGAQSGPSTAVEPAAPTDAPFRVETVADGLQVPWAFAFAPDGRIFVTERPGRVRVIENSRLRAAPLATIADVEPSGESGLMDVSLHPRFAENHLLYLTYAYKNGDQLVRVVRFREANGALVDRKVIVENIPAAQFHAGCRARFGPDGMLYVTTGDATDRALAQRLDSLAGKTLRLRDDGTVPPDNPFVGRQGARPEIWTYGHRNSQGVDWQPGTNLMFQTEHGPSGFDGPGGGDEVNVVERGKNYGWPLIHHTASAAGLESPILEYTPAVAPSGAAFYRGTSIPQFTGNVFFACLRGECLVRVVLDGRRVVRQERLLDHAYGRLREVASGPDGALYVSTSNRDGRGSPAAADDRILKLVPAK